jgi:hypothetical protein
VTTTPSGTATIRAATGTAARVTGAGGPGDRGRRKPL